MVASNRARDLQRSKAAEARALAKVGVDDESTDDVLNSLDIDVKAAIETLPLQQKQVPCSTTCSTNPWRPSRRAWA